MRGLTAHSDSLSWPVLLARRSLASDGSASYCMNLHTRYLQQAAWTRDLRSYLFERAGWRSARSILEVGCGTGAILRNPVAGQHAGAAPRSHLHGVDHAMGALAQCRIHAPSAILAHGDALALPYRDGSFDITYCHFLLLWVQQPLAALREMKRVTRGHVLALAEPDYTARVDQPADLAPLGRWQSQALRAQGADVSLGSRLADLFDQAGIRIREAGTVNPWPQAAFTMADLDAEWMILREDLADTVSAAELERWRRLDAIAHERGERVLYVPTYFAWGQV